VRELVLRSNDKVIIDTKWIIIDKTEENDFSNIKSWLLIIWTKLSFKTVLQVSEEILTCRVVQNGSTMVLAQVYYLVLFFEL
jgi:hypothetical protein